MTGVVRLASVDLSSYAVVSAVVADLLTRRGYHVDLTTGPHDQIYPRLGAGDFHLFAAAWLPAAHALFWRKYGRDLERWAALYDGARFFLALNRTMVPTVICIDDLASHAGEIEPTIQALTPRAGLTRLTRAVVRVYRLDEAGMSVAVGGTADWRRAIDRALAGAPIALALWTPLFTDALPFRPLLDPRHAFGSPDTAFLVAHRSAHDAIDAGTMASLRDLRIGLETVSAMDRQVTLEGAAPEILARAFVARMN